MDDRVFELVFNHYSFLILLKITKGFWKKICTVVIVICTHFLFQYCKSLRYHLDIIILQCRHGVLYWLANYFIYTIRNGTVRRWRQRVTFGRLTLMFRFSLSGRSLQTRGLGRNFSLLLSLTHSAHYYLLSLLLH